MAITKPMLGREDTTRGPNAASGGLTGGMATEYKLIIGQYLRELRINAGMTQEDMGKVLGGVSHNHVCAIEYGRSALAPEHYAAVVSHFGLDAEAFGEFILRYTSPWTYALIFGMNHDRSLPRDLKRIPHRLGEIAH